MGRIIGGFRQEAGRLLRVEAPRLAPSLSPGDSVAINGVCQTVVRLSAGGVFEVIAVGETLRRTTLGALAPGDPVNLELALRVGDRLGGHWVNGHVDSVSQVREIRRSGADLAVRIGLPEELARYVVVKGSIAIDGVSLTVGEVEAGSFTVYIIPETAGRTLFGKYRPGTRVNLEVDILAKYVERLLQVRGATARENPGTAGADGGSAGRAAKILEGWSEERGHERWT